MSINFQIFFIRNYLIWFGHPPSSAAIDCPFVKIEPQNLCKKKRVFFGGENDVQFFWHHVLKKKIQSLLFCSNRKCKNITNRNFGDCLLKTRHRTLILEKWKILPPNCFIRYLIGGIYTGQPVFETRVQIIIYFEFCFLDPDRLISVEIATRKNSSEVPKHLFQVIPLYKLRKFLMKFVDW